MMCRYLYRCESFILLIIWVLEIQPPKTLEHGAPCHIILRLRKKLPCMLLYLDCSQRIPCQIYLLFLLESVFQMDKSRLPPLPAVFRIPSDPLLFGYPNLLLFVTDPAPDPSYFSECSVKKIYISNYIVNIFTLFGQE